MDHLTGENSESFRPLSMVLPEKRQKLSRLYPIILQAWLRSMTREKLDYPAFGSDDRQNTLPKADN